MMIKTLKILFILAGMAGLVLFAECSNPARAQDDPTALNLARCLRAETDTYSGDWAGMAWVLRKRAFQKGVTLNEMVLGYCSVFDRRSRNYYRARSRSIRESTFEVPLHGRKSEWMVLRLFVQRMVQGTIGDPCPEADHFGNAADVGRKALVEVCLELGKRGNKFYKVKR